MIRRRSTCFFFWRLARRIEGSVHLGRLHFQLLNNRTRIVPDYRFRKRDSAPASEFKTCTWPVYPKPLEKIAVFRWRGIRVRCFFVHISKPSLVQPMKYFRYLPFYFLSLMSSVKNNSPAPAPFFEGKDPVKTYLALGDSYTIGESVPASGRFPEQTAVLLRQHHIRMGAPDIIATTGWTSSQLITAVQEQAPKGTYAVISLLIGVNDQYQGRSLEAYRHDLTQLLRMAVAFAGSHPRHVFVLSIPDYSVTPFAAGTATARIAGEIDQFNNTCRQLSMAAGVHFIDITTLSRAAKDNLHLVAADGLHPSVVQYAGWSALLATAMLPELQ